MKKYRMLHLALGFIVLMSNCSPKEIDTYKLCKEFYQLNKGKDFEGLFDVAIGTGRIGSVYDKSLNQYNLIFVTIAVFDTTTGNYVTVPVFKREASLAEKDSVFRKIKPEVKNFLIRKLDVTSDSELFGSYVEYVGKVYEKYYNIKTPDWFANKNVVLDGNPRVGKFITFELTEKVKVYYLADLNSLTEYWKKHFSKLKKFDDEWHYEITMPSGSGVGFFAHELKHAYQFETGAYSVGPRIRSDQTYPNFLYDKHDEIEAYNRGALFGQQNYTNINSLPPDYKDIAIGPVDATTHPNTRTIINSPQNTQQSVFQRIANNTGQAFRINGVTYYPRR